MCIVLTTDKSYEPQRRKLFNHWIFKVGFLNVPRIDALPRFDNAILYYQMEQS